MARLEGRRWAGVESGLTRRDRRPCDYAVYIPDPLVGRRFVLDGDVAADVADAEAALVRLDATGGALADTQALARLLLRAEAVASSRIEGLELGGRRQSPPMRTTSAGFAIGYAKPPTVRWIRSRTDHARGRATGLRTRAPDATWHTLFRTTAASCPCCSSAHFTCPPRVAARANVLRKGRDAGAGLSLLSVHPDVRTMVAKA